MLPYGIHSFFISHRYIRCTREKSESSCLKYVEQRSIHPSGWLINISFSIVFFVSSSLILTRQQFFNLMCKQSAENCEKSFCDFIIQLKKIMWVSICRTKLMGAVKTITNIMNNFLSQIPFCLSLNLLVANAVRYFVATTWTLSDYFHLLGLLFESNVQ